MSYPFLYIVATPIGNLSDFSSRAIETLKNCDLILSENVANSNKLLNKYNITTPQKTYRDSNKLTLIPQIIDFLKQNKSVSLITDSGTPTISDPGYKLVDTALQNGIKVVSIPGPSAVIAALSISGLPTDKFTFVGFLPKKGGQRTKTIQTYGNLDATMIIYESPNRIKKTLVDIYKILGERESAVVKEITKIYETVTRTKLSELCDNFTNKEKGEFVILIAKQN